MKSQSLFGAGGAVELDTKAIGVVEPDVVLFAVGVDSDAAVGNACGLEVSVDLLEVLERFDTESDVVEADVFLVVGSGCGTGCLGEEESGGSSDFVEEHVVILKDGVAEESGVEGFGSGNVIDAEDEVIDGECWEHVLKSSFFTASDNTNSDRTVKHASAHVRNGMVVIE